MLRSAAFLVVALFAFANIASAGHHEKAEMAWDQAEVTKLVKEFVDVVGTISVAQAKVARTENTDAEDLVKNDLSMLKRNAKHLARVLEQGQSRKATWPLANRCGDLVRRTRRHASETPVLAGQEDNVARAEEILAKLRAYYGVEAKS